MAAPMADAVLRELQRISALLEVLVTVAEEQREGERQLEALGQALAGNVAMSDRALIEAHFRREDGSYGMKEPDGTRRDATADETRRLEQLVGRKRRVR